MSHAKFIPLSTETASLADGDALPASELPISLGGDVAEWAPELPLPASVWEIFSSADDASGEALALAFAQEQCARAAGTCDWLWVQDAGSIRKGGRPYLHGLPTERRCGLVHVATRNAADALAAMEEGVRCGALSFVIGEIAGDPRSLDFTATRRLVLAAERHRVPLYLLRREGYANLSAARLRWRVKPVPSVPHRWNAQAPGAPRAEAELFRGRRLKPGHFTLDLGLDPHEPGDRLSVVPRSRDRPLEQERSLAG